MGVWEDLMTELETEGTASPSWPTAEAALKEESNIPLSAERQNALEEVMQYIQLREQEQAGPPAGFATPSPQVPTPAQVASERLLSGQTPTAQLLAKDLSLGGEQGQKNKDLMNTIMKMFLPSAGEMDGQGGI